MKFILYWIRYQWHYLLTDLHFCMMVVGGDIEYHSNKWRYHLRKCCDIVGLDFDKLIDEVEKYAK